MTFMPSMSLISNLAKTFALLLHLAGLTLFLTLLMLQQSSEAKRAEFSRLLDPNNLYALPYNLGELLALIALLSITLPILLQLYDTKCEIISPGRMVFLALMLVITGIAFAIRTPVPPPGMDSSGIGYLFLNQDVQLTSTYLVGMFTAFLGVLALFRTWPRTVILLLIMNLLYFSSGNILFNIQLKNNETLFALIASFTFLMLLISITALWMLRPQIEEDLEQVKAFQALKNSLKIREEELSDSEMANTILSLTRRKGDDKEGKKDKEVIMVNLPSTASAPTPPSAGISTAEAEQTQAALTALQDQINDIREAHRKAEKEKLAEVIAAFEALHERINRTLIGG